MSCPSASEAGISWFRFASGTIDVGVSRVGSPEPIVVSSSSASSAKRAGPSDVHWDRDVVHASWGIRGVESVWVLLIVEPFVRVALEVSLEIRKCSAAESSRLELWTWYVGCVTALLFQYVVEKFLASGNLYGALFQLGEVACLWPLNDIFQDVFG